MVTQRWIPAYAGMTDRPYSTNMTFHERALFDRLL